MEMSDAIREGSKLHPPTTSGWIDSKDGEVKTCALIAAAEAMGIIQFIGGVVMNLRPPEPGSLDLRSGKPATWSFQYPTEWTALLTRMEPSPCDCPSQFEFNAEKMSPVQTTIWHLHDVHRMTREAVAEWIGTIEDKMAEEKARAQLSKLLAHKASLPKVLEEANKLG